MVGGSPGSATSWPERSSPQTASTSRRLPLLAWRPPRPRRPPSLIARGGRVRVLTTTYTGATEPRALDALVDSGRSASLLRRRGHPSPRQGVAVRAAGLSTAYVGSSNLSHSALHDGLEWNVRSRASTRRTCSSGSAPPSRPTGPTRTSSPTSRGASGTRSGTSEDAATTCRSGLFDLRPFPHQERDPRAARGRARAARPLPQPGRRRDRHRQDGGRRLRLPAAARERAATCALLFVAHRQEILQQSLTAFRAVLRDGRLRRAATSAVHRPTPWTPRLRLDPVAAPRRPRRHRPGSLRRRDRRRVPPRRRTDLPAPARARAPWVLLGLTATPERTDGADVLALVRRPDRRRAAALGRARAAGCSCPFQYFGVADDVDLRRSLAARAATTSASSTTSTPATTPGSRMVLERARATRSTTRDRCGPRLLRQRRARALHGRAASTRPASPARASTASTPTPSARQALAASRRAARSTSSSRSTSSTRASTSARSTPCSSCGRPRARRSSSSSSAAAFAGRRARPCLTVLDFVGHRTGSFRFDLRYRAYGATRGELLDAQSRGFPFLPAGCHIELDRVATEIVLENIRRQVQRPRRELVADLARLGDVSLDVFLDENETELPDLYSGSGVQGWAALRRAANLPVAPEGPAEVELARSIGRLLHVSDAERIDTWRGWLAEPSPPNLERLNERDTRLLGMLLSTIDPRQGGSADPHAAVERLWRHPAMRDELSEVLDRLDGDARDVTTPLLLGDAPDAPLHVHARYTRVEILAAFGHSIFTRPLEWREGVRWDQAVAPTCSGVHAAQGRARLLSNNDVSRLRDSRELVHWESQRTLAEGAPTAQRYIHHAAGGTSVVLFARPTKAERAFTCLGTGRTWSITPSGPSRSHGVSTCRCRRRSSRSRGLTWPKPAAGVSRIT